MRRSKRIHYGKFIAEAKFQANEEKYSALITAHNAEGLMAELTKPAVEKQVRVGFFEANTWCVCLTPNGP